TACAMLALAARSNAQLPSEPHLKVELISEQATSPPGQPLWVGLLFRLEPGWHIYWQNPGDSGEPPKVQWNLPTGFAASSIRWPQPIRLGSGSVVDYGYEGQVLLMAPIQRSSSRKRDIASKPCACQLESDRSIGQAAFHIFGAGEVATNRREPFPARAEPDRQFK